MTTSRKHRIADLIASGEWKAARKLLEAEREQDPQNHWILTQLAVTFYERREYDRALHLLVASQEIVPDCPLTLWNLAGALSATGKLQDAVRVYAWIVESQTTPEDDPCWESKAWAAALKADCMYRLGVCFEGLNERDKAEQCFRKYFDLLLVGIAGTYSKEEVIQQIRKLLQKDKGQAADSELRRAMNTASQVSEPTVKGRRHSNGTRKLDFGYLKTGKRAAAKK
jgi:tetratricopeptide (TPR) repeat protein